MGTSNREVKLLACVDITFAVKRPHPSGIPSWCTTNLVHPVLEFCSKDPLHTIIPEPLVAHVQTSTLSGQSQTFRHVSVESPRPAGQEDRRRIIDDQQSSYDYGLDKPGLGAAMMMNTITNSLLAICTGIDALLATPPVQ